MAQDYLRPAAVKAGVLGADERIRFGFHNLRHSLATFLVENENDPKTVQTLLRHSNIKTTLELYARAIDRKKLNAQAGFLDEVLKGQDIHLLEVGSKGGN